MLVRGKTINDDKIVKRIKERIVIIEKCVS